MVDLRGFEPLTSSMPLKRAPNCATGPRVLAALIFSTFAEVCQTPLENKKAEASTPGGASPFCKASYVSPGWLHRIPAQ